MKQLIIIVCAVSALMVAQDAAGSYKLTGVNVEYNYVSRPNTVSGSEANGYATPLTVTDAYGFGITVQVSEVPASRIAVCPSAAINGIGRKAGGGRVAPAHDHVVARGKGGHEDPDG